MRIIREGVVVFTGDLALKRFKTMLKMAEDMIVVFK
jgi:hypothetical protein